MTNASIGEQARINIPGGILISDEAGLGTVSIWCRCDTCAMKTAPRRVRAVDAWSASKLERRVLQDHHDSAHPSAVPVRTRRRF